MRVLMLAQSVDSYRPAPDGFIVDWVRALARKVDKLTVLTYHYNPVEKLPANTAVEIIGGSNFLTRNVSLFWKTLILGKEADVIFAHILEVFGAVAGLVGKATGKRSFFWYCQGYDLSHHWGARSAFLLVDRILTATEEIKSRYAWEIGEWCRDRISVVGHGINIARFRKGRQLLWPRKGQPVKILYAGRISPIKDISTLERAVGLLRQEGRRIELRKIEKFAYVDAPSVYKSTHIFVTPTLSRSLDKALLEAIACGVPAIGTDLAYPLLKKNYFNSFVYKAGGSRDLARKIARLIDGRFALQGELLRLHRFVLEHYNLRDLMDNIANEFVLATETESGGELSCGAR